MTVVFGGVFLETQQHCDLDSNEDPHPSHSTSTVQLPPSPLYKPVISISLKAPNMLSFFKEILLFMHCDHRLLFAIFYFLKATAVSLWLRRDRCLWRWDRYLRRMWSAHCQGVEHMRTHPQGLSYWLCCQVFGFLTDLLFTWSVLCSVSCIKVTHSWVSVFLLLLGFCFIKMVAGLYGTGVLRSSSFTALCDF